MATDVIDSALPDLRDVPLGDVPALQPVALAQMLGRVLPDVPVVATVPVAAFSSAI